MKHREHSALPVKVSRLSPFQRGRLLIAALAVSLAAAACSPYRVVEHDSANQGSRIDYLVIHFTSENFADSLRILTQPSDNPVSAHYLVPETGDSSYPHSRLRIHRLVPEHRRAWHAGVSAWGDETSLNDRSIGIELVNLSGCERYSLAAMEAPAVEEVCDFLAFDDEQLDLLLVLARDILDRYPGIDAADIVGHADIAPNRKVDPGPTFPWKRLYDAGIGAWFDDETVERYRQRLRADPPGIAAIRQALRMYGYPVEPCGALDAELRQVLRAFQMHFVPEAISLEPDLETMARLFALLEKYRLNALPELGDDTHCRQAAGDRR